MVFDVSTPEKMEQSVANILGISTDKLKRMICFWETKALSPDVDMADVSKPFIQSNLSYIIDSVYLYHLNRSIEEPKKLYPLYKVLTTNNSFSNFLSSKGIEFEYTNQKLFIIYQGHKIPEKKVYDSRSYMNEHSLLAKRLGYYSTVDYCVNGFIHPIDPENSTENYYFHLSFSPEILGCLESFLKIPGLQNEYKNSTNYYYSAVLLPIESVIFDNMETIDSSEEKTIEFLCSCINCLSYWYNGDPIVSNRIIRVDDDKSLEVHHNILLA